MVVGGLELDFQVSRNAVPTLLVICAGARLDTIVRDAVQVLICIGKKRFIG